MIELIAEVSSNHGGSIPLAKEFIKRFAEAGANWVKFQTTRVKHLRKDDPQYGWFTKAELSDDAHHELKATCEAEGVQFLTTVYNVAEVPLMLQLGVKAIKTGSGEQDLDALTMAIYDTGVRHLRSITHRPEWSVHDLVTVARYPASTRACLRAIDRIAMWGAVGYSDHSIGLEMAQWAIECGATIIEKHVQLPNQARQIQAYEATIQEFRALRKFADEGPERFKGRWQACA